MPEPWIAPSILSADFARLGAEVDAVLEAGADLIHFDVMDNHYVPNLTIGPLVCEALHGCCPGLVFNPATPLDYLDYTLELIDMVLIMSVNPGFAGQQFIPTSLRKLADARARIVAGGREVRLEVDGGIKVSNVRAAAQAGADTFVAGSAIFGSPDYGRTIREMRAQFDGAAPVKARR